MMTCGQLRAARALLGIRAADLSAAAGVQRNIIVRAESGGPTDVPKIRTENLAAMEAALQALGIEFTTAGGVGVRLVGR